MLFMDTNNANGKKINVPLARLKGLGETIKKIEFHREKLFDLIETIIIQYQQIEGEAKKNNKLILVSK
jgi:hypothetical protein